MLLGQNEKMKKVIYSESEAINQKVPVQTFYRDKLWKKTSTNLSRLMNYIDDISLYSDHFQNAILWKKSKLKVLNFNYKC